MKIWILAENTSCREGIHAEHGLSLYLESNERKILFDAGRSGTFWENGEKMGVDLSAVDLAVLSHGHYDHGGGLLRFLEGNDRAPVYLHRNAFQPHFNAAGKDIGLDPALADSGRLAYVDDVQEIGPGMTLYSCNGREQPWPADTWGQAMGREKLPEDYRHEQYLLVEEAGKRILISGCSHKGILNLVEWFRPDVLVGGFHFMKLDPVGPGAEALDAAARHMLKYPTVYYTGHCTGEQQYAFLKERMGDRLNPLSAGLVLEI